MICYVRSAQIHNENLTPKYLYVERRLKYVQFLNTHDLCEKHKKEYFPNYRRPDISVYAIEEM
jgi:coproporphyrinogen III oxidase